MTQRASLSDLGLSAALSGARHSEGAEDAHDKPGAGISPALARAVTIGLAFASDGLRRAAQGWMTDKRFVVLVLGPIVIASICFTAAASLAKPDAFALRFGGHSGDHPGCLPGGEIGACRMITGRYT